MFVRINVGAQNRVHARKRLATPEYTHHERDDITNIL
jgi:hypothetical protein